MRVDLPAELSPTSPSTSPGYSLRSTSTSALTGPKDLLMPRISTIGLDRTSSGIRSDPPAHEDAGQGTPIDPSHPDVAQNGGDEDDADEHVDPMLRHDE